MPIKDIVEVSTEEEQQALIGKSVVVAGWARTIREQGGGRFAFVELNDGSCFANVQIVVDKETPGFDDITSKRAGTGASILIEGEIVKSPGSKQALEIKASRAVLLGECVPGEYPLAKSRLPLEHLRTIAHLRPRTNTVLTLSF